MRARKADPESEGITGIRTKETKEPPEETRAEEGDSRIRTKKTKKARRRGEALRNITNRFLDSFRSENPSGKRVFDSELRGFAVTAYPGGKLVFGVRYGNRLRRRWTTLGEFGNPLTLDEARAKARTILAESVLGGDPVADRKRADSIPTLKAFLEDFTVWSEKRKKPRTLRGEAVYRKLAERKLGSLRLDEIEPAALREVALELTKAGKVYAANRFLSYLSAALSQAAKLGHIPTNPAAAVPRNAERPRKRVLSAAELGALWKALEAEPDAGLRAAFTLLVVTGARASEAREARWKDIDLEAGVWTVPDTKAGRPQEVVIPAAACELLKAIPKKGPFVCPGRFGDKPRADFGRAFERIAVRAKLTDVTPHDLRRTLSDLIRRSAGEAVSQAALRHKHVSTTIHHYSAASAGEIRETVAKVLPFLSTAAEPKKPARRKRA